jgi:hypothetical protein
MHPFRRCRSPGAASPKSTRRPACCHRTKQVRHDDGELVAAESREHLRIIKLVRHPGRDRLQHAIAGSVSEQVVYFLEPIEVEAKDGQSSSRRQGELDLLIQLLVEGAAIGNTRQCIIMRQKTDVLLRLLVSLQVADRDCDVWCSVKIDRAQNQLDRSNGAVGTMHFALDQLIRPFGQLQTRTLCRNKSIELDARQRVGRCADEIGKVVIHGDDGASLAHKQSFDGCIGEPTHTLGFELQASAITHVDGHACQSQKNDDETRNRNRRSEPADR